MSRTSLWALALCASLLLGAISCAPPPPTLVPGTLSPDITLSGKWDSNYGRMVLSQSGSSVEGTVEHRDGVLKGELTGDLFLFDWEQPGDMSEARLAVRGKGWLRVSPGGDTVEGKWGYDDEREGGGVWRATRIPR